MRLPYTQVIANIQGYMYGNVCPNMSKRLYKYTLASRCYYMKNDELSGQLKKLNLTTTQYFTPRLRVQWLNKSSSSQCNKEYRRQKTSYLFGVTSPVSNIETFVDKSLHLP